MKHTVNCCAYCVQKKDGSEIMGRPGNLLSERLLNAIEDRIASGEYPPGIHLDEVELAETFGASRTPIREALIRLGSTGMIEKRPRKGWVVMEASPNRLCEMFEFMAELEAMCGRLAARRATAFLRQKILAAHEACRGVNDPDTYYNLNELFHVALYEASENGFLIEKVRQVQRQLRPYRRLQLRVPSRLKDSFQEHQGIVDATLAGDGERAAERLRAHVNIQGQRFSDLMASVEKLTRVA
jgi:DNA-binding GntR family transcriptional regulator